MFARTAVAMTTGTNFIIEGAVDLLWFISVCALTLSNGSRVRFLTLSCSVPKMEAR
jgi:hypothetical protein